MRVLGSCAPSPFCDTLRGGHFFYLQPAMADFALQYVKICSLYGAGFYYIPGTDTCLKVGGWVRMQMGHNFNGNMTSGPMVGNLNTRNTHDFMTRNRGYITADARTQTSIGTVRSYIAVGLSLDNPAAAAGTTTTATTGAAGIGGVTPVSGGNVGFSANRAFIQFANITAGLAQSFYDFMPYSALSYYGNAIWAAAGTDTGDGGNQVLAYTAQLGNGLSASLSLENPRNAAVQAYTAAGTTAVANALGTGAPNTAGNATTQSGTPLGKAGNKYPDIVLNLRVDQAWGSAQVMGAIHDASGAYTDVLAANPAIGITSAGNKTGYAIGAGVRVNLPMLGAKDYIVTQFNYAVGASKYASVAANYSYTNGATSGSGTNTDGDYLVAGGAVGPTTFTLTKSWSVGAGYEHNWNSAWKTSLYGGYLKVDRDDTIACSAAALAAGCTGDFSTWQVGSRTQWAPAGSNLEIGLDVIYTKLNARNQGADTAAHIAASQNQDTWIQHLRIQRNFLP